MLAGYIDGSNLHTAATIVVVGGCAADVRVWPELQQRWMELLGFCGVKRWHHTEFLAREGSFGRLGRTQRDVATGMLCDAFAAAKPMCFGYGVPSADYAEMAATHGNLPRDPYFFLLDRCLHRLIQGMYEAPRDEGMLVYCDKDKDESLVRSLAEWHTNYERQRPRIRPRDTYRRVETSHGSNLEFLPLQAADVVALELAKFAQRRPDIPFVPSNLDTGSVILESLKKSRTFLCMIYHDKALIEMEADGRAFVVGYPSGYRFAGAPKGS